jgi:hypothetical protein
VPLLDAIQHHPRLQTRFIKLQGVYTMYSNRLITHTVDRAMKGNKFDQQELTLLDQVTDTRRFVLSDGEMTYSFNAKRIGNHIAARIVWSDDEDMVNIFSTKQIDVLREWFNGWIALGFRNSHPNAQRFTANLNEYLNSLR